MCRACRSSRPFFRAGLGARRSGRLPWPNGRRRCCRALFEPPFFPKPFGDLPSAPDDDARSDRASCEIGGFRVQAQPLAHPGGAFAYRIQGTNGDLVYATDHEFGNVEVDDGLAAFCAERSGGHLRRAFHARGVAVARRLGPQQLAAVRRLRLGGRRGPSLAVSSQAGPTDAEIAAIEARARRVFPATTAAREGASFEI